MDLWIMAIAFAVIGILCVMYAHRFGRWFGGLGFYIIRVAPWLNFTGKTREETEHQLYDTWPLRSYWLFWLWGIRILGALLAICGIFVLIVLIMQR